MSIQLMVLIALIGLCAGIMSGLVGIGGGIVLVPALVFFLQYNQHQAQGTSLGVLTLPVVILGFLKYYSHSKTTGAPIDLKVVGLLAIGFIVGGYFGSSIAVKIDKELLRKIFGIFLLYSSIKLLKWDETLINAVKKIF